MTWDHMTVRQLDMIEAQCGGRLCVAARNLQTGETFLRNADQKVRTASVIKLPLLAYVALEVESGTLSWSQSFTLTDEEKVAGSGILTQLTAGLILSLRDVCVLMTVLSDNTATNMLIEILGPTAINQGFRRIGLAVTTLFRKSYTEDTPESRPFGLGVTTASEMLDLMTRLAEHRLGSPETSRMMLEILAGQQYRDGIPRYLPQEWTYAGKTGAIDPVRNDVGVVTTPEGRQWALALFCQELPTVQWTADNPGLIALARTARLLLVENDREEAEVG